MSWMLDYLRNSRLTGIAAKINSGEPVNWQQESQLQTIDIVRHGQLALADAIEREEEADAQFEALVRSAIQ